MKAIIAFAVLAASAPALAAAADGDESASTERQRRICTRVERRGASRLAYTRVCYTAAEWRERLGPDWRQRLAGRSPEDDLEAIEGRSRDYSNIGSDGVSSTGGTDRGAISPQ